MFQFKIWVKRVCKNIVNPFPNELNRHETAEKQCSWTSRLLGIANYIEL